MPRMTAAAAAVEILKIEGVSQAFGVPGAAINPFYRELKNVGGISHTLARHVEGASHMAEGYTRAKAGNIAPLLAYHLVGEVGDLGQAEFLALVDVRRTGQGQHQQRG
ncbi:thiamine pyrophosphate-binding protein, partial [Streptomyces goshikiensis]